MNVRTADFGVAQPPADLVPLGAAALGGSASGVASPFGAPGGTADLITPAWFGSGATPAMQTADTSGNPFDGATGTLGLLGNLVNTLQSGIDNLIAQLTKFFSGGANANSAAGFKDAEVDSTGDPHISVNGTDTSGNAVNTTFDSMVGHTDLVDANAGIPGGYQVSTTTTTPNANGVTYNKSATVTANNGNDSITMNADGSSSIVSNGQPVQLQREESSQLDGGEIVTKNQDGSLTVKANDGHGNTIETTMSYNGQGVDVKTHAHGLALDGDAVSRTAA